MSHIQAHRRLLYRSLKDRQNPMPAQAVAGYKSLTTTRAIFLSSIGKMVYMAQSEQLLNGSLHRAPVPPISIDKCEV